MGRSHVYAAFIPREENTREPLFRFRAINSVSTETDGDIIRRARDNPALFGKLYDRHAAVLYRYAARRAGEFAADDVIADTFLVAWERLCCWTSSTSASTVHRLGCQA